MEMIYSYFYIIDDSQTRVIKINPNTERLELIVGNFNFFEPDFLSATIFGKTSLETKMVKAIFPNGKEITIRNEKEIELGDNTFIKSISVDSFVNHLKVNRYYDNGNRLTADFGSAQSTITATYDAQDRLLTYGPSTGSGTVNIYSYSPSGSLLTKTRTLSGAETPLVTTYNYDAMGNLLKVVLPDNRVITYKIDARGRRIANHLGSPIMVLDYFWNIEVKIELKYDSFGQELPTPPNTSSAPLPRGKFSFGFAGGLWDEDTKLVKFGVRDYDPEVGRWTSKEPLGFAGSRNFYVYAGNDSVNFVDLDGMKEFRYDIYKTKNYKNMTYIDKLARYKLQQLICRSIENKKEYGGVIAYNYYIDSMVYFPASFSNSNTLKNKSYLEDEMGVKNGLPEYLGTPMGKMYLLEFANNIFTLTRFPDLDLSECKCPNKEPYNTPEMKNKCGSLE